MNSDRKLTAILFLDIQGYTSIMQSDEARALKWLDLYQAVLNESITQYQGEIVKAYGDGSICLFNSSLHAVQCARDLQLKFQESEPIPVRIGIHSGDVIYKREDVFGDALNIASRIESMGIAGSILLSKSLVDRVKNQQELKFKSLGSYHFKNVSESIEIFALEGEKLTIPSR